MVRMVHKESGLEDIVENRPDQILELHWRLRRERRVLELGNVQRRERLEIAEIEQRARFLDVRFAEQHGRLLVVLELLDQERTKVRRHVVLHLQTDDLSEAAFEHLSLDSREQILWLLGARQLQ